MTDRRAVLRWLASGATLTALGPKELLALGWRALDLETGRTLVAACERILPAGDTPGAIEVGVDRFVDRMLADWCSPAERDDVLGGLRDLDARSRERHGRGFSACAAEEQAALLRDVDDEASAAGGWFARLKELAIWGYFTSEEVASNVLLQSPLGAGRYEGCVPASARPVPSS
ncbi:MAG TPA: gluconate 2-dehydrogenase subunit 3 family protein [Vicinamibacteria bacterium]|nr:gluconate 2-dehydrogenase subunit 3 family protein [Vicinamibacteria bacterium]